MTEEKIALWKKREKQAKAKWQEMEAGKKHKESKKDNQRKFLLGAAVLEGLKKGDDPAAEAIRARLDGFLTRDHERALFELAPLSEFEKERRKAARARRISLSPLPFPEKGSETKPTETA